MEKRGIVVGPKAAVKEERSKTMRRTMTPAETWLWEQLRNNRCGGLHFRRQQVIDGFIADFCCHDAGLVVEVDGSIHQSQAEYDRLRDSIIAARGLSIIRFPNERVFKELPAVLQEIQAAVHNFQSTSAPSPQEAPPALRIPKP